MKLLGARLLCRTVLTENTFIPGGRIIATDERRDNSTSQQAEVLEVGDGERDEDGYFVPMNPDLKPGAWVLHKAFTRIPLHEVEETFLLHERDIVAIVEAP